MFPYGLKPLLPLILRLKVILPGVYGFIEMCVLNSIYVCSVNVVSLCCAALLVCKKLQLNKKNIETKKMLLLPSEPSHGIQDSTRSDTCKPIRQLDPLGI